MAKPRSKLPDRSIDIFCQKCRHKLFKYRKGGKGALVKCFVARITENYTAEPCVCPKCQQVFAREAMIKGMPAYKFIGGKVWFK